MLPEIGRVFSVGGTGAASANRPSFGLWPISGSRDDAVQASAAIRRGAGDLDRRFREAMKSDIQSESNRDKSRTFLFTGARE